MSKMKYVLAITITTLTLAGCTSKTPANTTPQTNAQQNVQQVVSPDPTSNSAIKPEGTFVPMGTVPPTVDKTTQQDIKQLDDTINSIDSDTYSSKSLNDLQ